MKRKVNWVKKWIVETLEHLAESGPTACPGSARRSDTPKTLFLLVLSLPDVSLSPVLPLARAKRDVPTHPKRYNFSFDVSLSPGERQDWAQRDVMDDRAIENEGLAVADE